MKKYYYIMFIVIGILAFACTEEPIGQEPIDGIPPGTVSNIKVDNTPGGAILTYNVPDDEDLLYVKAVYILKDGVKSEARSSLYKDTLKVVGFGDTIPCEVTLIAVDRSRNESSPVTVTIHPLVPAVVTIGKTISLVEDFGGVRCSWVNPTRAEISVAILIEDNNKEFVPLETYYSSVIKGLGTKHGLDTIPMKFQVYVQDHWGNRSEIKDTTLTPIYETKFDRLKFQVVSLPNDAASAWGWVETNLWDGIVGDQGFHTAQGDGKWPHSFTIDLGVTGRISRLIEWQRLNGYEYGHGNLRKFEIYGCEVLDPSGNWSSWTLLMTCNSIKPSGLPIEQKSAEDISYADAGEEFIIPSISPKVRYIRIKGLENWSGGDFLHISEIAVYGDNR